jgi:hypothetical protein
MPANDGFGLLHRIEPNDWQYRTEYFFLHQRIIGIHFIYQGRRHVQLCFIILPTKKNMRPLQGSRQAGKLLMVDDPAIVVTGTRVIRKELKEGPVAGPATNALL